MLLIDIHRWFAMAAILNPNDYDVANTVVSNHFHSVKILLFSSARSRDFDGTPGTKFRCQCTQQKLQSICNSNNSSPFRLRFSPPSVGLKAANYTNASAVPCHREPIAM